METSTRNRGFASMDTEKQREIARKGGRAAHAKGTAHEFSSHEARAAGRKGGESVSSNREHMSRIGRIGGKNSAGRRASSDDNGVTASLRGEPVEQSRGDEHDEASAHGRNGVAENDGDGTGAKSTASALSAVE